MNKPSTRTAAKVFYSPFRNAWMIERASGLVSGASVTEVLEHHGFVRGVEPGSNRYQRGYSDGDHEIIDIYSTRDHGVWTVTSATADGDSAECLAVSTADMLAAVGWSDSPYCMLTTRLDRLSEVTK